MRENARWRKGFFTIFHEFTKISENALYFLNFQHIPQKCVLCVRMF